jgi:hypothetical protein
MSPPTTSCITVPARRRKPAGEPGQAATRHPITVSDGNGRWEGTLYSFSMQGIELVLGARLEPGTVLGVELARRSRFFTASRMLRVGRVQLRPDGSFLVECQFCYPLAFDHLYDVVS